MTPEDEKYLIKEFIGSGFFRSVFLPWIDELKVMTHEAIDKAIDNDESKYKLSIIRGERKMINTLEEQISVWTNRAK